MNRRMTARIAYNTREEFGKLRVDLGHYTDPRPTSIKHAGYFPTTLRKWSLRDPVFFSTPC